ncbi:MAG TPA: GAP family protein [Solirubrobacteraceae bacterium]|nr:GAP family protein [Solirubrobacteraceae bacterium]
MIENVALLGLSCALNPVLLGVVLLTLASERPKRMLGAYTAGAFTWSVGIGIGVVRVASGLEAFGGKSSPSRPIFDLVAGVALLAGAAFYGSGRAARRKERRLATKAAATESAIAVGAVSSAAGHAAVVEEAAKKPLAERLLSGPIWLAFVAGVVLNFPSVRYIEAMKEIVVANVAIHEQVLAILLFNVLMLSPAIVPLAFLVFRPEGTRAFMTRLDAWLRAHSHLLLTIVLAVLGLYLIAKGVAALG